MLLPGPDATILGMGGRDAVSTFIELLLQARQEAQPVAVYSSDSESNDYDVGFVEVVSNTHLVLNAITPKGESDGRHLIPLEHIHRVDSKTAYVNKLKLLHQYHDSVFESTLAPVTEAPDMVSMLEGAKEHGHVVSLLDAEGYGPSGFVKDVASDHVELQRLNSKGMPDGVAVLMLEAVHRITVDTREERVLGFLFRYHYELQRLIDS